MEAIHLVKESRNSGAVKSFLHKLFMSSWV